MNILLTIFVVCSISLQAQAQFVKTDNPVNASANALTALVHTMKKSSGPKDSISGTCTFSGSSCNGADISLYHKDHKIFSATLTSGGSFTIPKLKRHEVYKLILTWAPRDMLETRSVEAGDFVVINIEKKPDSDSVKEIPKE